jgi:hypothetical protein
MERISTAVTAKRLNTSQPTVRRMLKDGLLQGTPRARGTRIVWDVDPSSVDSYLKTNGRLDGKRRTNPSRLESLESQVAELRQQVRELVEDYGSAPVTPSDHDDLRAEIVDLRDALARTREALELQRKADEERAAQVDHLLEATKAGERAEGLRRKAIVELDDALAGFTQPGHLGRLDSGQR